jgi:hypothetical protein
MSDRKEMNMTLIAVVSRLGTSLGVAADDLKVAAEVMQYNVVPHAVQMKEMPLTVQHKEIPR